MFLLTVLLATLSADAAKDTRSDSSSGAKPADSSTSSLLDSWGYPSSSTRSKDKLVSQLDSDALATQYVMVDSDGAVGTGVWLDVSVLEDTELSDELGGLQGAAAISHDGGIDILYVGESASVLSQLRDGTVLVCGSGNRYKGCDTTPFNLDDIDSSASNIAVWTRDMVTEELVLVTVPELQEWSPDDLDITDAMVEISLLGVMHNLQYDLMLEHLEENVFVQGFVESLMDFFFPEIRAHEDQFNDLDGDGIPNYMDTDLDGDGLDDSVDPDDDNDGTDDEDDAFPRVHGLQCVPEIPGEWLQAFDAASDLSAVKADAFTVIDHLSPEMASELTNYGEVFFSAE